MKKYNQSLQYTLALEASKAVNGVRSYEKELMFTTFTYEEDLSLIFLDTHCVYNNRVLSPCKRIISLN
jgi:hypothetical protein